MKKNIAKVLAVLSILGLGALVPQDSAAATARGTISVTILSYEDFVARYGVVSDRRTDNVALATAARNSGNSWSNDYSLRHF